VLNLCMWMEGGFACLKARTDKIWNHSEGGDVVVCYS
jgi:hypothetical protein